MEKSAPILYIDAFTKNVGQQKQNEKTGKIFEKNPVKNGGKQNFLFSIKIFIFW